MMRIILVTSQVTYVEKNYLSLIDPLIQEKKIAGLVILKNFDLKLFLKGLTLPLLGARGIGKALLVNSLMLPFKERERRCHENGIPVVYFNSMNEKSAIAWVKSMKCDLIINARTRCIYKKEILSTPRLGCINIHHGLLPEFRGTFCDLYALYERRPAGFSIHQMNEKIDQGDIIHVEKVSDGTDRHYPNYLAESAKREAAVLLKILNEIEIHGIKGIPNSHPHPTFTKNPDQKMIKRMLESGVIL